MITLTAAERALDVFRQHPAVENRLDWLAHQLLALVAETRFLSLRLARGGEGTGVVLECSDSVHLTTLSDPGPLRLFRTLLARLAKMAEEENGTAFNPYGGTLHFQRPSSACLTVEFTNTSTSQSLTITTATT